MSNVWDSSSACIPLVGGQRLKVLMIMGTDEPPSDSNALGAMTNALSLIPQSSPNITQLIISFYRWSSWDAIIAPLSQLIQALSHLEKLSCHLPLLDDGYRHLVHLTTFRVFGGQRLLALDHPALTKPSETPILP